MGWKGAYLGKSSSFALPLLSGSASDFIAVPCRKMLSHVMEKNQRKKKNFINSPSLRSTFCVSFYFFTYSCECVDSFFQSSASVLFTDFFLIFFSNTLCSEVLSKLHMYLLSSPSKLIQQAGVQLGRNRNKYGFDSTLYYAIE